ncbi:pak1ip1 [Symbiodinium microadriaticum]|nr:pak1ip1 [Symbiodinium microadriaticum]
MVLSGKKKQEKHDCHAVVAGAEDRTSWHFGSKNCKCPPDHVVAGKSWECGEALGHRHFSSRMAISTCSCEPTSKCEEMVAGAKTRNSASKFADRPCKCENPDEVLDGQAHECSTYLGERYFPNTLPPQECSCQPNVLGSHNCGDIAAGALEVDKDGRAQCECPQEQFINGEDQQCKDFFGARFFPKRLKPGLCSCSANARRPDRPGSGSYRVHLGVAPVLVALAAPFDEALFVVSMPPKPSRAQPRKKRQRGKEEALEATVVVGTYDGGLLGFGLKDGAQTFGYAPHIGCIKAVHCNKEGKLASGATDNAVRLFDLAKRVELGELQEHQDSVSALQFWKGTLITASSDGQVCIWRGGDFELLLKFQGHKAAVTSLAVHPSGRMVASAGRDKRVQLWDLTRGTSAAHFTIKDVAEALEWSPCGESIAVLSARELMAVQVKTSATASLKDPSSEGFVRINFTSMVWLSSKMLALGDAKGEVRILSHSSDELTQACTLPKESAAQSTRVKALAACAGRLLVGLSSGEVEVWLMPEKFGPKALPVPTDFNKLRVVETKSRLTCLVVWAPEDQATSSGEGQTGCTTCPVPVSQTVQPGLAKHAGRVSGLRVAKECEREEEIEELGIVRAKCKQPVAQAKEAYHELFQLQERAKKLKKVREELELRTNLRKKGVAIQVAEGSKSKPAQYRWLYDRKR